MASLLRSRGGTTNTNVMAHPRPQSIIREPGFIPRHATAAERDGQMIALVDNLITN